MNVEEDNLRRILREELDNRLDVQLDIELDAKLRPRFTSLEARLEDKFDNLETRFDNLETRFGGLETKITDLEIGFNDKLAQQDKKTEAKLANFFGQVCRYLDTRLDKFEQHINTRLDSMQNAIDAIVGRLDTDEIERAAIGVQLVRHDSWIHQLSKNTGTKLSSP